MWGASAVIAAFALIAVLMLSDTGWFICVTLAGICSVVYLWRKWRVWCRQRRVLKEFKRELDVF